MKTFVVEKEYLLVPICTGPETKVMRICLQESGELLYEFDIPVGNWNGIYRYEYYGPVPVGHWMGRELVVTGDFPPVFFDALSFSNDIIQSGQRRPKIHFSANTGWINDPNGLLYDKGCYHLYFQYNPFNTLWGNMCWGHAVSRDLLHWEQLDTVMYPDAEGTIYSGCGLKNEKGLLGLPEDAFLFPYTSAGGKSLWSKDSKFRQKIAYSLDGGRHVEKREGFIVDYIAEETRDPKVYWHEESGGYYMVLYVDGNDFAILRSEDLEHWEKTQDFTLDRAWECPDLRKIPVEGGGSRWVFMSADGFYYLGDFDGYRFETDGIRRDAYQTCLPYAAQTFLGTEDVILIAWLRTKNTGRTYCGTMCLPKKLTLDYYHGELRLRQLPVKKYYNAAKECFREIGRAFRWRREGNVPLELRISGSGDLSFSGRILGNAYAYDSVSGYLTVEKEKAFMGKGIRSLSIILDEEICEVTAEDGFYYAAFEIPEIFEKRDVKGVALNAAEEMDVVVFEIADEGIK